jgi:hypothetical protein
MDNLKFVRINGYAHEWDKVPSNIGGFMKIVILPPLEQINDMEHPIIDNGVTVGYRDKHAVRTNDKILNVWNIGVEDDPTIQSACDGIWKCNENGNPLRNKDHKITVDTRTLKEIDPDDPDIPDKFKQSGVDDWVEYEGKTHEFLITPESGITQADLDAAFAKRHYDFGNGYTPRFKIDGKPCGILVLKEGQNITASKMASLISEITSPV